MAKAGFTPFFASDRIAAQLLDMKPTEFRKLVGNGDLPQPCRIGDLERWDMQEIGRIISGEAIHGMGDIQW